MPGMEAAGCIGAAGSAGLWLLALLPCFETKPVFRKTRARWKERKHVVRSQTRDVTGAHKTAKPCAGNEATLLLSAASVFICWWWTLLSAVFGFAEQQNCHKRRGSHYVGAESKLATDRRKHSWPFWAARWDRTKTGDVSALTEENMLPRNQVQV